MTIFSASGISKSYNDKTLFNNIAFGMESGDKIGIIGKNGAGKTTLMKIIAGLEQQDAGEVVFNSKARYVYLEQIPDFNSNDTALDYVLMANPNLVKMLEEHHNLCNSNEIDVERLNILVHNIELANGWNYENEAKKVLYQLGISDYYKKVYTMSGGLKKRVALARALLLAPELLILDEPTNHLDADSVQWLQDKLQNSVISILFVTHDRYFLDAVANKIIEIADHRIFSYPGSYELYLEQKEILTKTQEATQRHTLTRLRSELSWLQKGAKARRTKQKSRIDWVQELAKSIKKNDEKKIKIELGNKFLGSKIIEAYNVGKTINNQLLFNKLTYIAKPKDRIGIIGPNGSGKSTLLSVLAGLIKPDTGRSETGMSVKIGYFEQEIKNLKNNQSVIGTLKEVADFIDVGVGRQRYLTTQDLLERFAFPRYQHSALVSTLSGGEKRRLALCHVLMANPNVLLLDEPTNDFDLQTLAAFEEYLDNFFGVLLIVSHDRFFLDRTVNFIWAFDGKGNIKEYPGNYSNYLQNKELKANSNKSSQYNSLDKKIANSTSEYEQTKFEKTSHVVATGHNVLRLSFKEKYELNNLTELIPNLEEQKTNLELLLQNSSQINYKEIEKISLELEDISKQLEDSTARWFELSDKS